MGMQVELNNMAIGLRFNKMTRMQITSEIKQCQRTLQKQVVVFAKR